MWTLKKPDLAAMERFRASQSSVPFTYAEVGATKSKFPVGFAHDRNEIVLGKGRDIFDRAVAGLFGWKMFPNWAVIYPPEFKPAPNEVLTMLFHLAGIYWKSAGRIVYLVDESDESVKHRLGFAYGTLPGHVECGEERFTIAWRHDDTVVYELQAFSRPRYWMARLAKPLARKWQRKFVLASQQALKAYVTGQD